MKGSYHRRKSHNGASFTIRADGIPSVHLGFLAQLKDMHKRFGREGAIKFLRETEIRQQLGTGSLDYLMGMVST